MSLYREIEHPHLSSQDAHVVFGQYASQEPELKTLYDNALQLKSTTIPAKLDDLNEHKAARLTAHPESETHFWVEHMGLLVTDLISDHLKPQLADLIGLHARNQALQTDGAYHDAYSYLVDLVYEEVIEVALAKGYLNNRPKALEGRAAG